NPLGWTVRTLADGTAVLTMPSWATYSVTWDWKAFLDSTVTALAGAPRLVVDLRENEGGSDVGDALLSYLARAPLSFPTGARYVRYRTLPDRLRPHADTWDRSFDDWNADIAADQTGELLRMTRWDDGGTEKTIRPDSIRYDGRVAVLVGPVNSSATYGFAQDVQRSGLARLVGQTTGGNQRGINGGAFYFFRLPGSGIEVDIPLIGYYPPGLDLTGVPDAGIEPDVAIPVNADDLATGRDRTLDAAVVALSE
ncbi:MAG TPA: S41 family peptidase, partial [Rubricoccaceae bacterium]